MPGPSNPRKNKGKSRGKGSKRPSGNLLRLAPVDQREAGHKYPSPSSSPSLPSSPSLRTPSPFNEEIITSFEGFSLEAHIPQKVEQVMFQPPFIHDPGNGPRVRDPRIFMSSFFAKPAALDVRQLLSLHSECSYLFSTGRIHFVRNLLRKRYCKCCAQYYQKKLHWFVSLVFSIILIAENHSDSVVQ